MVWLLAATSAPSCDEGTTDRGRLADIVGPSFAGVDRPRRGGLTHVLVARPVTPAIREGVASVLDCHHRVVEVDYSHADLERFMHDAGGLLEVDADPGFHMVGVDEATNQIVASASTETFPADARRRILARVPSDAVRFEVGVEAQTTGPR